VRYGRRVVRKKFDILPGEQVIRFKVADFAHDQVLTLLVQHSEHRETRRRQAEYFCQLAETSVAEWNTKRQNYWLTRLDLETPNLQEALSWLLDSLEARLALRLVAALSNYWQARGALAEGRIWLEAVLAVQTPGDDPQFREIYARALRGNGKLAQIQGEYERANACFLEALNIYRQLNNSGEMANCLNDLGLMAIRNDNYEQAYEYLEEALARRRQLEDKAGIAGSLNNLGLMALHQMNYERAVNWLNESLELKRQLGNNTSLLTSLGNLGLVHLYRQEYSRAEALFYEALHLARQTANRQQMALCVTYLGQVAYAQKDYADALVLCKTRWRG
jgi:tetratricopeptide (TPR) repeat protein